MILTGTQQRKYFNVKSPLAFKAFSGNLIKKLQGIPKDECKPIVFVCIGTDRSTGDSFGPLVGHKILGIKYKETYVYGTLDNPVHAKNLSEKLQKIRSDFPDAFIIAIDACLGSMQHVGHITLGEGPIVPGAGVSKSLEAVGDIHITGIVNFGGFMDFLILQNTRLSLVMKMADLVSEGIKYSLWKCGRKVV